MVLPFMVVSAFGLLFVSVRSLEPCPAAMITNFNYSILVGVV